MSCFITYAQEEAESTKASTFEKFLSKTGTFVRHTEYKLPDVVKGTWKSYAMTADLRKLSSENEDIWFLHIEKVIKEITLLPILPKAILKTYCAQ